MNQNRFQWPDARACAVSLTYDDALPVHYEHVAHRLDEAGIKATFNVPISHHDLMRHPDRWRALAASGHELGNHTLFHPCRRKPSWNWLEAHYDLCTYTRSRFHTELEIANFVLHLLDGRKDRTYGNTCCNTTIGPEGDEISMDDILRNLFVAARGPMNDRIAEPAVGVNLMQVGHFGGDGMSCEQLKAIVQRAQEVCGWVVLMFHGVGEGTHSLFVDKSQHGLFIRWLAENKEAVWTVPFLEAASHVKQAGAQCSPGAA